MINKKAIAIITARGGSKRIPKKNIKDFCGKPIIAYSIEVALNSGLFDTVMVSTDSDEIAEIAIKYGAEVPFMRSTETANDYATTADVIMEVIKKYNENGIQYDYIFCLYPTAPFITLKKLTNAMDLLINNDDCFSILPVCKFSFPPQRGIIIKDNFIEYKYPENINIRSQDLEFMYHDCGQFYAIKTEKFCKYKILVTDNTYPLILSDMEVQDIDNIEDWEIAEIKYKLMINHSLICKGR